MLAGKIFRIGLASLLFANLSAENEKPNILLIVSDDQGYNDLG